MKNTALLTFGLILNSWALPLPAQLSVTIQAPNALCVGQDNGVARATATGGTGYTYQWSNHATGPVDSTVNAGPLQVTVTDNSSQTATASVVIAQDYFGISVFVRQPDCKSLYASIQVDISSGSGVFTYRWSNSDTGANLYNLGPGTYVVTVTDTFGCHLSDSVTAFAVQDSLLIAHVSATGSIGNNGTASVTVVQGNSPFTYLWNNGDSTSTITGLPPGIYQVIIADRGRCKDTLLDTVPYLTAISNLYHSGLSIYPNPANDYACLTLSEPSTIEIWDATGKRVYYLPDFSGAKLQLDLRAYPPGNYLLGMDNGAYRKTAKLVVIH